MSWQTPSQSLFRLSRSSISKWLLAISLLWLLSVFVLAHLPKKTLAGHYLYSTAIYARQGELLRLTLGADQQYRLWVPLAEMPEKLRTATLLYEDRWFYYHPGVNPLALLRSAWMTYGRGAHQGGSTITMQVARQLYRIDSRSPWGKLKQVAVAIWLEMRYSKDEILEAYLNTAPYGGNIAGAAAASLLYFHKPVSRLSLPEALTLAVIPQNPRQRFPNKDGSQPGLPSALQQARSRLWQRWLEEFPHDKRYTAGFTLPLTVYAKADKPFFAPHLTDSLLRKSAGEQHIRTGIDLNTQLGIKRMVDTYLRQNSGNGIRNAAVLLADSRSMQVRAMNGSGDYWDRGIQGQVNGTQAKRSPGSTLKPFIYALGLEQGLLHPNTILADTPASYGPYSPENFDHRFLGPLTAQEALIRSRNITALHINAKLNKPSLYELLQQAGITGLKSENHYGLSLALGGGEVTMTELVQLYAMLANQGQWQPLHYHLDREEAMAKKSLLNPASAYITLDMLSHNPRPDTKRPAYPEVAWKTGTSWGFKDAWAIGIFGKYVLAVWVGNFDNQANNAFTGVKAAGPLFFAIIDSLRSQHLLDNMDSDLLPPKPDNVAAVNVCTASGDLPNENCPQQVKTWFIPGVSPIKTSSLHKAVYFNEQGEVVCKGQPYERREVFEFWPDDMAKLFQEAGMPRRKPPSLPSCYNSLSDDEAALEIVSPSSIGTYTLQVSKNTTISLKAKSRINGVIFWFANKSYIGKAKATENLSWTPEHPGTYLIRAADSQGHAVSKEVTVAFLP